MGTPCLSQPKEPSLSSLAGALLLLDSGRSPHSQALPNLASPTSDVGLTESVRCPGSAAKSRGDHFSAQSRPCGKFCKKRLGFVATSVGPLTKNCPTSLVPQAFFILYVFLERNRRWGSPISLPLPLVSLVSPNRGRARDGLCSTCSNRLKTSSNPVNSKCACKIWQGRNIMSVSRKLC